VRKPAKRRTSRRTGDREYRVIRRPQRYDEPGVTRAGFLPGESLVRVPDDDLWWEPMGGKSGKR